MLCFIIDLYFLFISHWFILDIDLSEQDWLCIFRFLQQDQSELSYSSYRNNTNQQSNKDFFEIPVIFSQIFCIFVSISGDENVNYKCHRISHLLGPTVDSSRCPAEPISPFWTCTFNEGKCIFVLFRFFFLFLVRYRVSRCEGHSIHSFIYQRCK